MCIAKEVRCVECPGVLMPARESISWTDCLGGATSPIRTLSSTLFLMMGMASIPAPSTPPHQCFIGTLSTSVRGSHLRASPVTSARSSNSPTRGPRRTQVSISRLSIPTKPYFFLMLTISPVRVSLGRARKLLSYVLRLNCIPLHS